jgi:hypothetical protein
MAERPVRQNNLGSLTMDLLIEITRPLWSRGFVATLESADDDSETRAAQARQTAQHP